MDSVPGPSKRVRYNDKQFEETVKRCYNEIDSDVSDIEVCDSYYAINSDHDSESELDCEESDKTSSKEDQDIFRNNADLDSDDDENNQYEERQETNRKSSYGKNKYKWSTQPHVSRSRTMKHNIVRIFFSFHSCLFRLFTDKNCLVSLFDIWEKKHVNFKIVVIFTF